jgi:3-hydroxymyristoyl/3-hydroxydecanoyl-(acyl carrier protein) dehydratase
MIDCSQWKVEENLIQKSPAVYIDNILSYDYSQRLLIAEKRIKHDEYLLKGHFPGNPVVPGILIIESMSQSCTLCGLATYLYSVENGIDIGGSPEIHDKNHNNIENLVIKVTVKFKNKIFPEETLEIHAQLLAVVNSASIFKVKAYNKEKRTVIASGEIIGIARINGNADPPISEAI